MHLGSSLASKSKSSSAIACSHLKTKSVQTNSDYPNGACYTIKLAEQSEAKYDKIMIPFENRKYIKLNVISCEEINCYYLAQWLKFLETFITFLMGCLDSQLFSLR